MKIALEMLVAGSNIGFQIEGTNDLVKFSNNEVNSLIDAYKIYCDKTITIKTFPDGGIGTNWDELEILSKELFFKLATLLESSYYLKYITLRHPMEGR